MSVLPKAVLAVALSCCALQAAANTALDPTLIYHCRTVAATADSLFTDEYQFAQDQTDGTVVVLDPLIRSVFGKPIHGKIKSETADDVVYLWLVKPVVYKDDLAAELIYTLTLHKATNSFDLTMAPLRTKELFNTSGACTANLKG